MKRTTTLALALLASSPAYAQSVSYPDFSSIAGLNLVGLASQSGNILRLQDNVAPPVSTDNRGAAWYATPLCVVNGFDTTFTYRMHTPSTTGGSDGLAFVIQNDQVAGNMGGPGNTSIGRHAAAIGYGLFTADTTPGLAIDNSLAIELDTFLGAAQADPDSNHISIHTNGTGENNQAESFSLGVANSAALGVDLNNGVVHTVRVVYTPTPGQLDVYLDGVLKLTVPYNFVSGGTWVGGGAVGGITLIGGTSAYVGFTSSAGSAREFRDVQSWTWSSPCGPAPVPYCFGDGSGTACPCGNVGTAGNGCANSVQPAGASMATSGTASIVSDALVLTSSGIPNGPGLYFQGTLQLGGGSGVVFGDGLRCVGGSVIRLGIVSGVGNSSTYPSGAVPPNNVPVSVKGLVSSGDVRNYQLWYRDSDATFCSAAVFNLTNAAQVTWF